jgi:excinuclease ABC subunit C
MKSAIAPTLLATLEQLPTRPGCYLFRGKPKAGAPGEVLYVGKAKSLRARVRSYFQDGGSDDRYFVPFLRKVAHDVETVVTATEKEAAILENSLIKQYQPRYNVKLRDDKEFLNLRLDVPHEWPRLDVVRKPTSDGARYFGPFHSATAARRSLHLVNKHFQLRTCTDQDLRSRARPCLQHQIKRCAAPCVHPVDKAWYDDQVRAVELFLSGRHDELTRELGRRMKDAAGTMEFELAAIYRDQLRAVESIRAQQRVVQTGAALEVSQDVVGLHREGDLAEFVVLYVRQGRLTDTGNYSFSGTEIEDAELIGAFLAQHYAPREEGGSEPPDEILLPLLPEAAQGVEELLAERRGRKVELLRPQRGPRAHLAQMATDNARHAFQQKRRASEDVHARLEQLRDRLRLQALPRHVECCDISHLGGGDTVGAIVALLDGAPAPRRYKWFHVRGVDGGDDYGAVYEVLARRFRRAKLEGNADAPTSASATPRPAAKSAPVPSEAELDAVASAPESDDPNTPEAATDALRDRPASGWALPDLFVVDGGRGQLAAALAAARDLGLHQLPIVALAKEKDLDGKHVVDRVYLPGQKNPIELREHSASMFFLARARDEAHRFANKAREKVGTKRRMRSAVEDLRGIGPELRKELLRTLGSLRAIEAASDELLLSVPGFEKRHLTALRKIIPAPTTNGRSVTTERNEPD